MKLAIDACALTLLINPDASPPEDPTTGQALLHARERILHLIQSIESDRGVVIIPTPVLAEVLVGAGDAGPEVLATISKSSSFRISAFDVIAAVELAQMTRQAAAGGKRRDGDQPYQKIKLDRQIVAISRTAGASAILSDDRGLCAFALANSFHILRTHELPIPDREWDLFDDRDA